MYGRHLLIDFHGCDFSLLNDRQLIEQSLLNAAVVSKATILQHCFHQFAPQGVSGVIVIAESHISIHTWPEKGYAALDIFTCGREMRPEAAIQLLRSIFEPRKVELRDIQRGRPLHPKSVDRARIADLADEVTEVISVAAQRL